MSVEFPKWMAIAIEELGTQEIVGREHNPRVLEYHSTTTLQATTDEVPWCSSFVNWVIEEADMIGTRLANARSWLNWGKPLTKPRFGAIVVFKRGNDPLAGHVGFFIEYAPNDKSLYIIGGNQSNKVKMSEYREDDVLGYFWPNRTT